MKKILLFMVLFIFTYKVDAFENDIFSIDIPDDYVEIINENSTFKWGNDNSYILITISDNSTLKYDIARFDDDDIQNQKKYIQESINNSIKDYDIEIEVNSITKIKFNDSYILKYNVYWPTKDITGFDTFQIGNIFTTKKYIITFYYSSDAEINEENYKSIINSINIKDESNSNSYLNLIIFIMLSVFCIFTTVKVILDHKKQ